MPQRKFQLMFKELPDARDTRPLQYDGRILTADHLKGEIHAMWKQTPIIKYRRAELASMLPARQMLFVEGLSEGALPADAVDSDVQGGRKYEQIGVVLTLVPFAWICHLFGNQISLGNV